MYTPVDRTARRPAGVTSAQSLCTQLRYCLGRPRAEEPAKVMTELKKGPISLPDGVWTLILYKLPFHSKVCCERVNRQLRGLLRQPASWQKIDVTLEQLVGVSNMLILRSIMTPAGSWILDRIYKDESQGVTHINLKGHASCIAEGLSVSPVLLGAAPAVHLLHHGCGTPRFPRLQLGPGARA
ncbi:hypothetical protein WJX73_000729 [Symbiochloris irregularis]|uniref:F-box domain-containing protein n=1 Tax=Symbiochloris irregularis TaxID=706552 RepID=A0AAW1P2I5_9CHLO